MDNFIFSAVNFVGVSFVSLLFAFLWMLETFKNTYLEEHLRMAASVLKSALN